MADVSVSAIVTGLVSGVISAVLTYFTTRSKIRLELTVEYDTHLHNKRLDLYTKLWPETKDLARYGSARPLTYKTVSQTAESMRNWYFDEGGIYLSKRSRKPYFALKKKMQRLIDDPKFAARPDDEIQEKCRDSIYDAATRLRTSLADDIRTRKAPWL
jgi:hypothetical protein